MIEARPSCEVLISSEEPKHFRSHLLGQIIRMSQRYQEYKDRVSSGYFALLAEVNSVVALVDAEYAFQALFSSQFISVLKGYRESVHGAIPALLELAAFHLYPHFGKSDSRDPDSIQRTIDLLVQLNEARVEYAGLIQSPEVKGSALQHHLLTCAEVLRGSSSASHRRRLIEKLYGRFDKWLGQATSVAPCRALEIVDAMSKAFSENISRMMNEQRPAESGEDPTQFCERMHLLIASSFNQIQTKRPDILRSEWDGLLRLIGYTPSARSKMAYAREGASRPIFSLSGDRALLFNPTLAYEALFDAYDQASRADAVFRDKSFSTHAHSWMVLEVVELLGSIFPPESLFKNLLYPDPDKPGGEAELDLAVAWGPFLILAEVKGKRFHPKSRVGDLRRMRNDLERNLEDSFKQAQRALRFIDADEEVIFREKHGGRKLHVKRDRVRRIFPVSITLRDFAWVTTQLAVLREIDLFRDSTYPWAVSITDLNLIIRMAATPDIFLHYVQRRLDLQHSQKGIFADEVDLWGSYLETRLHPSLTWGRKLDDGSEPDRIWFQGASQKVDNWLIHKGEGEAPDITRYLPKRICAIVKQLRSYYDDNSRWIAFAILDLSPEGTDWLERSLDELAEASNPTGRLLRLTYRDGSLVLSVIAGKGFTSEDFEGEVAFRTLLEKYRLKVTNSFAVGIRAETDNSFDCAYWAEGPWKYDQELESVLNKELPKAALGQKMPQGNDPCFCGSGKKFDACCEDRLSVWKPRADQE